MTCLGNRFREELYFKYFARTKFITFRQRDILPVAVFFKKVLKRVFTSLNRDLISATQKFKTFTRIKCYKFRKLTVS